MCAFEDSGSEEVRKKFQFGVDIPPNSRHNELAFSGLIESSICVGVRDKGGALRGNSS